jgi:hypothetical protein
MRHHNLGLPKLAQGDQDEALTRFRSAQAILSELSCRFRILDSCVSMVQPAEDRICNSVSEPFDLARVERVLS